MTSVGVFDGVHLGHQSILEVNVVRAEALGAEPTVVTFAEHPKAVLTRRQLIDAVWGPGWYGDEHVVDVHIGHVRDKLGDDAASPRYIRTVRGVGYGMVS